MHVTSLLKLTTLLCMGAASALPQNAKNLTRELDGNVSDVPECPLFILPPWPEAPCQFSLTSGNASLRLVSYSSTSAPANLSTTIQSTLGNTMVSLAYEQGDEPIGAFTRRNDTFKVEFVPENTTTPIISDFHLLIDTKAHDLTQKYFQPGDWRPEIDVRSKVLQTVLFLAWVKIYFAPTAFLARNSVDYEIWGNETVGLLGKISLSVGEED